MAEFDGITIYEAGSFDNIREVFADEEYKSKVIPDEEKFVDRTRTVMLMGHIVSVHDDPT